MSKTKISIILDCFLITMAIFVMGFIWLNRYIKNAIYTFITCIFLSFFVFFILFKHFLKKFNLNSIKNKELKFADKCFSSLLLSDQSTSNTFFEKLLNAEHISKNFYKNENSYFYVNVKSVLTSKDFIDANEFYLEQQTDKPLCFLCKTFDTSFSELVSLSEIEYNVFSASDVFLLMKSKNQFPVIQEAQISRLDKLKKAKSKFLSTLSRKHFKSFFLSGMSLFLISIFVPFTSYYMIFGTVLLILSIICLFKKDMPQKSSYIHLSELINVNKEKNKDG